jgi:phage N-6-adenine-methyltransferase
MTRAPTPDILGDIMAGATAAVVAPTTTVPLTAIVNDGGTQMRAGMNADTVKEYEDALTDADAWPFPPIVVYHDGARYWLADGFHRLNAAHRSGKFTEIPADIKPGTRRDAVLYAAGANASHGLRRTNEDKKRAVKALLEDADWSKWSDREIARRCAVSDRFVNGIRRELSANGSQMPTERTVERGSQTYQQNTANIGANRPQPPAMLAVWELEATVREVYAQVYGGNPEPYSTRDMRTGAQMRAGRFWLLCTQSLPANQFRQSDLTQAINNFAGQLEARVHAPVVTTTIAPTVAYVVAAEPIEATAPAVGKLLIDYTEEDWEAARVAEKQRIAAVTLDTQIIIDEWAAAIAGHPNKAARAQNLAPVLMPWIQQYRDKHGRDWADLARFGNPSHTNSTFWSDITRECTRRQVTIDEDVMKQAIRLAFDELSTVQSPAPEPVEDTDATEAAIPVSQRSDYESDEWYTPAEYVDAARAVMGAIDLDPATSEMAQTIVRAGVYLTRFDDGLAQVRWLHQRIWLNPPYSNPAPWIEKLVREHQAGPFCTEAIVLVNNATETTWFQALLERYPVCLPARRLAFWRHDHANVGARQGQAFFYLGPNVAKFQEIFSQFGPILQRLS